jgi:hypothetical protein
MALLTTSSHAAPFQSWLTASWSQRYDYGLEGTVEVEQRFASGPNVYQRYEITPQLIWHFSPRYDFSVGYEENREWDEAHHDQGGHEAFASTTIKLPLKQWLFTSRQRVQGGFMDGGESSLVFRQQTRLSYEIPRLPFRLKPFVQDEWFFDLINGGGLQENRAMIGLRYTFNKAWGAELYGMRLDQWTPSGQRTTTPVLGLNLNASF